MRRSVIRLSKPRTGPRSLIRLRKMSSRRFTSVATHNTGEANFPIAWRTVSARRHATVRRTFDMLQMARANQVSMMCPDADMHSHSEGVVVRSLVIGLTAFLTVVDLFATQAILPSLARHYDVTPAAMGFAVNASTMGMAVAGLAVGFFSPRIDRRLGILVSLALLSLPTVLLASAPNLTVFPALPICQA